MLSLKREDIKVGTDLYLTYLTQRLRVVTGKTVTIFKIGRKWAYWGDDECEKLDLETMNPWYSGYGNRNELWDSEDHYKDCLHITRVINSFRHYLSSSNPAKHKKLTDEKAVKILAILNEKVQE